MSDLKMNGSNDPESKTNELNQLKMDIDEQIQKEIKVDGSKDNDSNSVRFDGTKSLSSAKEPEPQSGVSINSSPQILKVIKPIDGVTKFETVEDFNKYYDEHKVLINSTTTNKLNKMFEIPGFKITRLKGELSVKNIPHSRESLVKRIEKIEEKQNQLFDAVNAIINVLNNRTT